VNESKLRSQGVDDTLRGVVGNVTGWPVAQSPIKIRNKSANAGTSEAEPLPFEPPSVVKLNGALWQWIIDNTGDIERARAPEQDRRLVQSTTTYQKCVNWPGKLRVSKDWLHQSEQRVVAHFGEKLRTRNSGHETTPIGGAADLQQFSPEQVAHDFWCEVEAAPQAQGVVNPWIVRQQRLPIEIAPHLYVV
jgi:hypothetical protein